MCSRCSSLHTRFALPVLSRSDQAANILGPLQVLIEIHGHSIAASLFHIARKPIQGSLLTLNRDMSLALMGAEREFGLPSLLALLALW